MPPTLSSCSFPPSYLRPLILTAADIVVLSAGVAHIHDLTLAALYACVFVCVCVCVCL